jgi:hypothetical protein
MRAKKLPLYGAASRKRCGHERRDGEKRAMTPDDGRLKRIRGETKQLNVEVEAELKTWLACASRDHRMTYVELVERGLALASPLIS